MNSGNPAPPSSSETVILIPAYQAQGTIRSLVREALAQHLPVIVVDDASSDGTFREAEAAGAQVIRRLVNGGKGLALREGLEAALKRGYRWIMTMDADGQHLPAEIPRLLQAKAQGKGELIVGNRMWNPKGMPLDRWLTNWGMSRILSAIAGQRIPDSQCGFRLISRRVLEEVDLSCNRFEVESELIVKSAWAGCRIASIPVSSVYRRSLSFIHPVGDTIRFFRFLFTLRKGRRKRDGRASGKV